jgi:hypothetical protein
VHGELCFICVCIRNAQRHTETWQRIRFYRSSYNEISSVICTIAQVVFVGFPQQRPGFCTRYIRVGLVADDVALRHLSSDTSASPANYHSTDCSRILRICRSHDIFKFVFNFQCFLDQLATGVPFPRGFR